MKPVGPGRQGMRGLYIERSSGEKGVSARGSPVSPSYLSQAHLRVPSSLFYFHHNTCQELKWAPLLACCLMACPAGPQPQRS